MNESPDTFLTSAQLAERWSCSIQTLWRKRKSGELLYVGSLADPGSANTSLYLLMP